MRARQRAALAGVALMTGPLLVGQLAPSPADAVPQAAEKPKPGKKAEKPNRKPDDGNKNHGSRGHDNGNGNGNGNGKGDGKPKPKPKPKDRTPPATPMLGGPGVGPGGAVSLPVIAESGSYVVVAEAGGSVVATGTGVGSYSSLAWHTSNGRHTYVVTATDRAGNRSGAAETAVVVDAVPPRLGALRVTPGTPSDTRTRVRFRTEPGSRYRILAGGRPVAFGRTSGPRVERLVDLADGRQRVTVIVRDLVGNPRSAFRPVRVRIPELAVDARFASDPTKRRQVLRVAATPTVRRGVVRLPGQDPVSFVARRGALEVALDLEDGTYRGGTVVVRDTRGRTGRSRVPTLTVDTSAPVLEVTPDTGAAADGSLRAAVTADDGAEVRWRLVDPSGDVVASGEVVAEDGEGTLSEDVDEGSYRLVAAASDSFGRTTTVRTTVDVAQDPVPAWLIVLFGAILTVGAVLAVAGLVLLVRWARRPDSPVRPAVAAVRGLVERRRRALLGVGPDDEVVGTGIELFEPEVATARVPQPRRPRRVSPAGEVLHRTPVRLYETAEERDDGLVLGSRAGELVLTRERIAVVDDRTGETWSARIADLAHIRDDTTMVLPAGKDDWVGLVYGDPERTRPVLDLLAAEHTGRSLAGAGTVGAD